MAGYKFLILRAPYHNNSHPVKMPHFLYDGDIVCL
jgi:hypothetical protein